MKKKEKVPTFNAYSQSLINELKEQNRYGTAQSYEKVSRSFTQFLACQKARRHTSADSPSKQTAGDIALNKINATIIQEYNSFLRERNVVRNTISYYNRALRAIYNKGAREFQYTDVRPFSGLYTGVDRTVGRAVSEQSVAMVAMLELKEDTPLALARDMFVFSYTMRGMPFVDMAYLRKSQIKDNELTYSRHKTGGTIRVHIEGEALKIINKYSQQNEDSEYLFPILDNHSSDSPAESTHEESYARYRSGLTTYNRNLNHLARLAGIREHLSSHVARHSWASAARSIGSGVPVISEALGHSSERMTRIYMGSLDSALVDETNRKILDRLNRYCMQKVGEVKAEPIYTADPVTPQIISKPPHHRKNDGKNKLRSINVSVSTKEMNNADHCKLLFQSPDFSVYFFIVDKKGHRRRTLP